MALCVIMFQISFFGLCLAFLLLPLMHYMGWQHKLVKGLVYLPFVFILVGFVIYIHFVFVVSLQRFVRVFKIIFGYKGLINLCTEYGLNDCPLIVMNILRFPFCDTGFACNNECG